MGHEDFLWTTSPTLAVEKWLLEKMPDLSILPSRYPTFVINSYPPSPPKAKAFEQNIPRAEQEHRVLLMKARAIPRRLHPSPREPDLWACRGRVGCFRLSKREQNSTAASTKSDPDFNSIDSSKNFFRRGSAWPSVA